MLVVPSDRGQNRSTESETVQFLFLVATEVVPMAHIMLVISTSLMHFVALFCHYPLLHACSALLLVQVSVFVLL